MRKLLFFYFLLFLNNSIIKAQLSAGDLAIIGYNTDQYSASVNDDFTFITLTDIPAGELIYFTDAGWWNTSWNNGAEGHFSWTAPAGGVSCGTIIHIYETSIPDVLATNIGSVSSLLMGVSGWNLASGDQVLIYQNSSGPGLTNGNTFITAIHGSSIPGCQDPTNFWTLSSCMSTGNALSNLPSGLTNGVNCISLFPNDGLELDNAKYTGTLTGDANTLRALINNPSNWSFDNNVAFEISSGVYSPSVFCFPPCTDPDVPTLSATPGSICPSASSTLTISGNLNDATAWHVYTGSCGGTHIGTTATSSFVVSPSTTTTYYIRGEGGCVTPGSCGTVTVNVTSLDNASFSYGASAYSTNASNTAPTITGLAGGTFNSTPAGLIFNTSTGEINPSTSIPGTYTVTYTTNGACPNSSNVQISILPNIVISEIMYNSPEAGTDTLEFIEIYNNDNFAVDLTGYTMAGVTYTFPSATLNSGEYYVMAVNSGAFNNVFGFMPDGQFSGGLSNAGEFITIKDALGNLVDSVRYFNSAPWPSGSSAGLPNGGGSSIILCDVNSNNNVGTNWNKCVTQTGVIINGFEVLASPGSANFCCPILSGNDTQVACDSLVWIDGNTYYANNTTATFVVKTIENCDSTVTLNLTINPSPTISSQSGNVVSCGDNSALFYVNATGSNNGYEWYYDAIGSSDLGLIDGSYTEINYDTDSMTIQSLVNRQYDGYYVYCVITDSITGCSVVSENDSISVLEIPTSTNVLVECSGFSITIGSNIYNSTGIYIDTLFAAAANGCDSIVTTDLTIGPAIDITVDNSSMPTLTANQTGATYRWLDCDNGNAYIGAVGQSYTATINGNYAVEITVGSCVDTSACENITGVGVRKLATTIASIYPNPTTGLVTIDLGKTTETITYTITTVEGRLVESGKATTNLIKVDLNNESKGIYLIKLSTENATNVYRLIKQ